MYKTQFTILLASLCLFCQCSNGHQDSNDDFGSDYPSRETFSSIDTCMGYMDDDPLRAHQMIDTLASARLMTQTRRDYFHAMILFCGEKEFDGALDICNRLLDEGNFGDDRFLEEEICVLASNITSSNKRHVETLRYANRGIAICHGNENMRDDEATLLARIGVAQQNLGRIDEARETYARAYSLLKENQSFGDLVALISLQKKQAGLYRESKEYDKVISIYHEILDLIERFDRDPSFIGQRPETMQESSPATHSFAAFYKCQIYAQLARAYRLKVQSGQSVNARADKDTVNHYIELWSHTDGSQSADNLAISLRELYFTGRKAAFNNARPIVEDLYRGDSLSSEYVDYLTLLAEDAAASLDYKTSHDYLQRAVVVNDSLRKIDLMRELTEQLSLYKVQEHELARHDAENELSRSKLINRLLSFTLCIIFLASFVIILLIFRNRRNKKKMEKAQKDLAETQAEVKELEDELEKEKAERAAANARTLYERIERTMEEQKLYLDPDLDIVKLAVAVYSSRSTVSACINNLTGKSFRTWLSEYRLELFEQKLRNNPEESIDELVMQCGYKEQSTFRRQFKQAFGMTAGEYRRQLLQK